MNDSNLMEVEEQEIFNKIFMVKKKVYNFINQKELISTLVEIIEKKNYFEFQVKSDKRFLTLSNLFINLNLSPTAFKVYPHLADNKVSRDELEERRRVFIYEEIVEPFLNLIQGIFKKILNQPINDSFIETHLKKIIPENREDLISNINNFVNFSDEEAQDVSDKFSYIFSVCSSIIMPPKNIDIIKEDVGFRLEILI